MNTLEDFKHSKKTDSYPPLLQALWHEAQGNWHKAHHIAQDIETPDGAWVHAYLHRKEGDLWNADYWYRRAGRTRPEVPLEEEWEEIAQSLLQY